MGSRWWLWVAVAGCGEQVQPVVSVAAPAAPVGVAEAEEAELDDGWRMPARVRARSYASLGVGVTGELRRVEAQEGAVVEEGVVLAAVDDSLTKAQLDRAKSEHDAVAAAGMGGTLPYKLRMDELSIQLVKHEVRAPFRGLIAARYVDPGDWVFAGDTLFDLVSIGTVEVLLDGPPEMLGEVQPGVTTTLYGKDQVLGEVVAVIPVVDPKTGTIRVRIEPVEPREWLVHGASIEVQTPMVGVSAAIAVPREALVRSELGPEVIRVANGRAVRVAVQVLAHNERELLVRAADLRPGDKVVIRGGDRLYTGQLLSFEEEQPRR